MVCGSFGVAILTSMHGTAAPSAVATSTAPTTAAMLLLRALRRHSVARSALRSASTSSPKFAFVGAGKMAEAMLAPLATTEILGALPEITFYDVSCAVAQRVATKYPAAARAKTLEACVAGADVVVLCTKPQNCDTVLVLRRCGRYVWPNSVAHGSMQVLF